MDIELVQMILCIALMVMGVFLMVVVLFQSGKRSGLSGAISGAADTFLSKNTARTWDARLAKLTKWVAAVFILVALALNLNILQL